MNVRELIADLNQMLAYNQDIGDFEVVAYDGYYHMKIKPVTELRWDRRTKKIAISTEER